ncbi:hypothetical protein GOV12_05125 [Candidatus Pacearchaeota archaeon]|nr:hypothetical protein [Candidatus Pacearchaeota archaeon]
MAKREETVREEAHMIPLRYGRTDGENLPFMQVGKFFSIGYNPRYGLVDVCEDNGDPFFEGRVNIENELPRMLSKAGSPSPENVDQYLTNRTKIMKLESELAESEHDPMIDSNEIKSKINEYKDELGFDFSEVDSEVDQYIKNSYDNWVDYTNNPGNYANSPDPILEVLTYKVFSSHIIIGGFINRICSKFMRL